METNRRTWFKQAGLIAAGIGLAPLKGIADPIANASFFPTDWIGGTTRLSSNENPYGPSPMARTAMADAIIESGRYQWGMIKELMAAVGKKNNVTADNILVGAGSTQIIDTVLQFTARTSGNFICAEPTFSRWAPNAETLGLRKIAIPVTAGKRLDLQAMSAAINTSTRMFYICNPNNPTGTIWSHNSLTAFIKEASQETLVVVDEAYLDYTNEPSVCNMVGQTENLIVIKTFSKIYGLAGARIGYAIAHPKTIEKLGAFQSGANIAISAVSLAGALASLKDTDFIRTSFSLNEKAKTFTMEQLEAIGIPCIQSSTNFIYFSLANYKKDFFALLKANNIEGTHIYEETGKWSRITVGTMEEMKRFISVVG